MTCCWGAVILKINSKKINRSDTSNDAIALGEGAKILARTKQSSEKIENIRNKILDSSLKILEEHGPEQLSMRSIADQFGFSHMALYTYFSSRAELMRALADRFTKIFKLQVEESLTAAQEGDFEVVLRETLQLYVQFACEKPNLFHLQINEWLNPSLPDDNPKIGFDEVTDFLAAMFEIEMKRGQIFVKDPHQAAITILSLINGPLVLYLNSRLYDRNLFDHTIDEAIEIIMAYVRTPQINPVSIKI